jgi:hypothetical protein
MADTAHQDAVGAALDSLSDEIEIARGAQQLASNLVDRVIMEGLAPARRQTKESSIDADDLLPLQVILSRHVASLEQIMEALNAL